MSEEHYFGVGFICGLALCLAIVIISLKCKINNEESGYKDKMTITYHCPDKEYERNLFWDVVNGSGVQTNFINRELSMDKNQIRIRLTNPK